MPEVPAARSAPTGPTSLSAQIWSVADLPRGDGKPHEYGRVILPFTVLRRLDGVLTPRTPAVLKELADGVSVELTFAIMRLRSDSPAYS